MRGPAQFQVNETWIIFKLNDAPVTTTADGDFNVLCLMDAASGYILANEFVSTDLAGISELAAEKLIEAGTSQAHVLPKKFFVSIALESDQLSNLARRLKVEVTRVPGDQLLPFVAEARDGFAAHIGAGKMH